MRSALWPAYTGRRQCIFAPCTARQGFHADRLHLPCGPAPMGPWRRALPNRARTCKRLEHPTCMGRRQVGGMLWLRARCARKMLNEKWATKCGRAPKAQYNACIPDACDSPVSTRNVQNRTGPGRYPHAAADWRLGVKKGEMNGRQAFQPIGMNSRRGRLSEAGSGTPPKLQRTGAELAQLGRAMGVCLCGGGRGGGSSRRAITQRLPPARASPTPPHPADPRLLQPAPLRPDHCTVGRQVGKLCLARKLCTVCALQGHPRYHPELPPAPLRPA